MLLQKREIRMRFQKRLQRSLVFQRIERTGAIQQTPAGCEHDGSLRQNIHLALMAGAYSVRRPLRNGYRILAEHPFAAAWRVYQNLIKKGRTARGQPLRRFVENQRMSKAHPLHVF